MISTSTASPNNAGSVQRTKLTGWAQAAARSLPKQPQSQSQTQTRQRQQQQQQQQQQQLQLQKSRSHTASPTSSTAQKASSQSNPASSKPLASNTDSKNNKKKPVKQTYNRDEVKQYMKGMFDQYSAAASNQSTYRNMAQNNRQGKSLNWGTVTNNKYKNRKYGCINEVAQALLN